MVLTTLLSLVIPGWYTDLLILPGGILMGILLSAIMPGGLLSLVFAGIFVWLLGSQLEGMMRPWHYVAVFLGAGVVGSLAATAAGGFGLGASFAAFGLAGAYAYILSHTAGPGPSMQWVFILLLINVVLSGFNIVSLAGMAGAFVAGLGISAAAGAGR